MSHNPKPETLVIGSRVVIGMRYTGSVPLYGRSQPSLATFERDAETGKAGVLLSLQANSLGLLEAHVLLDGPDEAEFWLPARRCFPLAS